MASNAVSLCACALTLPHNTCSSSSSDTWIINFDILDGLMQRVSNATIQSSSFHFPAVVLPAARRYRLSPPHICLKKSFITKKKVSYVIGLAKCAAKVLISLISSSRYVCDHISDASISYFHRQLGGDGTVLFTSWLFQRIVPPVLPFALGSLGFLTNFDFADHQAVMDSALDSGIRVNLRMRFTCTVYRAVTNENKLRKAVKKGETGEIMMRNVEKDGWEAVEGNWSSGIAYNEGCKNPKDKEIMCFITRPVETFEVLNDLVVDRGPSPFVSLLELFGIVMPFILDSCTQLVS